MQNNNNSNNNNNNNNNNDLTTVETETNSWVSEWKSNVVSRVGSSLGFTAVASAAFYALDRFKHNRTTTATMESMNHSTEATTTTNSIRKLAPFHKTRAFRTINFAANITSMTFLYFGCQQYLKMNSVRLLPKFGGGEKTAVPEETSKNGTVPLSESERLAQHALSGFVTGSVMHFLMQPNRVLHSWRLGLLFALGATATVKGYDQFTWWKFNRLIRLEEEQKRIEEMKALGQYTEEEQELGSWFDRMYDRLPEWLRKEDEDTAELRQKYNDIRIARDEIRQLAELEQEEYQRQQQQQQQKK